MEISNIVVGNFLDATNPENIEKYKKNLKILVEKAKKRGKIDDFLLIRNDEFLPQNWKWRVNSRDTIIEKNWTHLSQAIREDIAKKTDPNYNSNSFFDMPISQSKLNELMSNIDKKTAFVMMPARFRSTKHFTINTPLSHTHDYNHVSSERNFNIIHNMNDFLSSGYAYSASYHDAYLDVTHEGLSVPEDAVILISETKYAEIIKDPIIIQELRKRKFVVFRGDEGLAINMLLTEMNVLPSKPGNKYIEFDNEIINILENSIKQLCISNNISYDLNHANHFTDLFDELNKERNESLQEYVKFLKEKFPQYTNQLDVFTNMRSYEAQELAIKMVKELNSDVILTALEEYNHKITKEFKIRNKQYINNRDNMPMETKTIFRFVVMKIKEYFHNSQFENFNKGSELEQLFITFYHSNCIETQLEVAKKIIEKLNVHIENEITQDNQQPINVK